MTSLFFARPVASKAFTSLSFVKEDECLSFFFFSRPSFSFARVAENPVSMKVLLSGIRIRSRI
jgi:hypothetical protein